jgi:hypothetical protein
MVSTHLMSQLWVIAADTDQVWPLINAQHIVHTQP